MSKQEGTNAVMPGDAWASIAREVLALNVWSRAFGFELTAAEPDRVVLRSSGDGQLCRQATGQWVGEALEVLASITAGTLPTNPGDAPGTFVAPYGATVRTIYHIRPSSSAWVEAEARWVRRGRTQAVIETLVRDAEGRELLRVLSQHAAVPEPLVFTLEDMRASATDPATDLVRRLVAAERDRNLDAYGACLAADVEVWINGRLTANSREAQRAITGATLTAFPDWERETLGIHTDGTVVGLRWRGGGTHSAPWGGVPAWGNHVDFSGTSWCEVVDGLITRISIDMDMAGPMRQMSTPKEATQ